MRCLVCAGSTRVGLFAWHRLCPSCCYESAELASVINEASAHNRVDEMDREVALRSLRAENFKVIVELIDRLAPVSARRLLDVGSAHGWFLEEASKRFDVVGIEPDTTVAERARDRGLPVRIGYFPEVLNENELFDVIVFNDVIEHIPDIKRALQASHDQLNPDGLLVLNLPRSSGVFYRVAKVCARLNWHGPFERMAEGSAVSTCPLFQRAEPQRAGNAAWFRTIAGLPFKLCEHRGGCWKGSALSARFTHWRSTRNTLFCDALFRS